MTFKIKNSIRLVLLGFVLKSCTTKTTVVKIQSVDEAIRTEVFINGQNELNYSVKYANNDLILDSKLGLRIDDHNLGEGVEIKSVTQDLKNESYPWIGNQNKIHDLYNACKIELYHKNSNRKYFLEVRNYNNGVAFRYIIPSIGISTVYGEHTTFKLPEKTKVWYASSPFQYGWIQAFQERNIEQVNGELLAPPATFQLANDKGYMSITEGSLYNFHGAVLMGKTENTVNIGFVDNEWHVKTGKTHGVPDKDYYHKEVRDVHWEQENDIVTPWRIVMYGKDLNELVNNNMVALVNPIPDKELFPMGVNTEWIKPGKSLWTWLSERHQHRKSSPELYLRYINDAANLNIEYLTIDEGWYHWKNGDKTNWDIVQELTDYGKKKNVGIWLWKSSSERNNILGLDDEKFRWAFMNKCRELGVVGLKVDFFHTENKFTIDLMEQILIDAAKHQLLVVFHGVNKPTGECRTYPNMLAKEAVRGLECVGAENTWAPGPPWPYHNTVIPFTRLLAGPADYTPMHFGRNKPKETTRAHQIVSPYMFTSPMMFFAADPEDIYASKAKDIITQLPVQWDETKVLPQSSIGEIAVFVRRKGDDAYLIILNGQKEKTLEIPFGFIKSGEYHVDIIKDKGSGEDIEVEKTTITTSQVHQVDLLAGGGYLIKINGVSKLE